MTRGGKPTLNDVATRAGVSTTTASYILNGRTLEMRISSRHRAAGPPGRRRACLPAQPERAQPAHGHHRDGRHDLRLHRRRPRGQPPAHRRQRGRPRPRPPRRDRGERRPARRGGALHRGHARPPGRRHRLRHPGRPRDHHPARPGGSAGGPPQLHGPRRRPAVGDARRRARRAGRGPGSARRRVHRAHLRRRRGPVRHRGGGAGAAGRRARRAARGRAGPGRGGALRVGRHAGPRRRGGVAPGGTPARRA